MAKQNKLNQVKKLIETAHVSLDSARQLLNQITGANDDEAVEVLDKAKSLSGMQAEAEGKIIEGIFDGQNMIGPDGKQYSIPANYASKSKLVFGDTLKLTIKDDGSFLYKQIGPVDRNRLVGILAKDEITDEFKVIVGDKSYKVLLASVTYFKGEAGDETVILIPKDKDPEWAAVENIIKEPQGGEAVDGTDAAETPELEPMKAEQEVEEIEELG